MTTRVVFETNSPTIDNEAGRATGCLPGELSAHGREQARLLGKRRRDDGIAAVFSSDLGRAMATVAIAFDGSAVPVFADWRLRDSQVTSTSSTRTASRGVRRSRASRFLPDLALRWDGARVLVVGHIATRWAFEHVVRGVPLEDVAAADFEWQPGWDYEVP